jgi:S-DNA-T family DNA segregation ATPase FtsK/SpoIIIE
LVVYLIDPKSGVDYLDLESRLADRIPETPNEALPLLEAMYEVHCQRLALLKAQGFSSLYEAHSQDKLVDVPWILLAIDEMAVFNTNQRQSRA